MQTKISCLPVSLYKEFFEGRLTIETWSEKAKALGLAAIDINALFIREKSEEDIAEIRKRLSLPVLMVSAYSDFTHPDKAERARVIETAKADMRRAKAIGAAYIRLTAGQHHPEADEAEMLSWARDGFLECAKVSEETGVKILLENHSQPGAWAYPDYVFDTERFLKTWAALSDLPIGVNFDTANAYALGAWEQLLAAVSGRIETVHLNDLSSLSPLGFALVGAGIVPLGEMMEAIYKTGFSGAVCIEEASFTCWDGISRAATFAKELCQK